MDKLFYKEYDEIEVPEFLRGDGWQDTSWHNDACASSEYPLPRERAIRVWVSEDDPSQRDMGPDSKKFIVQVVSNRTGNVLCEALSSDDPEAVRAEVERLIAVWSKERVVKYYTPRRRDGSGGPVYW